MKKQRWVGLAFGLATALLSGLLLGPARVPAQEENAKTEGKEGSGTGPRAQAFITAFNTGNAKALAAFWTPEGVYIDQSGREYKGRAAIERLYKEVFAASKGAKLKIHVTSKRSLTPDVAIEEGITEVYPANGDPSSAAKFRAVGVKRDDVWYFESVQESVARPPSNEEHFADLAWLIGDWTGESDKGQSARFSFSWADNKNFMVSSFAVTVNGIPVTGGHQWIAWDAVDKKIRSWSFFSGGGFGEGVWSHEDGKWAVQTSGKSSAGKMASLTSVISQVDPDHFTWQITQLTVNGQTNPAGAVTRLRRVKGERP